MGAAISPPSTPLEDEVGRVDIRQIRATQQDRCAIRADPDPCLHLDDRQIRKAVVRGTDQNTVDAVLEIGHGVIARVAVQNEGVSPRASGQGVCATTAIQLVGTVTTRQCVIARTAEQIVIASKPGQLVTPVIAFQPVRFGRASDGEADPQDRSSLLRP